MDAKEPNYLGSFNRKMYLIKGTNICFPREEDINNISAIEWFLNHPDIGKTTYLRPDLFKRDFELWLDKIHRKNIEIRRRMDEYKRNAIGKTVYGDRY